MLVLRVMDLVLGPQEQFAKSGQPTARRIWFPGGQPVSLEGSNLSLLGERR